MNIHTSNIDRAFMGIRHNREGMQSGCKFFQLHIYLIKHTMYALFFLKKGMITVVITYDSLTGQSKRFASKISERTEDVNRFIPHPSDEILLVTRTFRFGEIPEPTKHFLDRFAKQVIAVCVSGNKNWGKSFGIAGDKIQTKYGIPLIHKFESSGFDTDVNIVREWINNYKKRGETSL